MTNVILERRFDPPLTDERFAEISQRLKPCLDRSGVIWVRSHLSGNRKRLICHFRAPDADAVRGALRQARLDHERVWPAKILEP